MPRTISRRGDVAVPAGHRLADPFGQIDRAVGAEVGAELAGLGVDRDQARVERAFDDARGAGRVRRGGRIAVIGDAAAGRAVGNRVVRHLRIVAPPFLAGGGVERDDDVLRRAQEDVVADLDRRRLRRILALRLLARQIAGAEGPDALQLGDIVAC